MEKKRIKRRGAAPGKTPTATCSNAPAMAGAEHKLFENACGDDRIRPRRRNDIEEDGTPRRPEAMPRAIIPFSVAPARVARRSVPQTGPNSEVSPVWDGGGAPPAPEATSGERNCSAHDASAQRLKADTETANGMLTSVQRSWPGRRNSPSHKTWMWRLAWLWPAARSGDDWAARDQVNVDRRWHTP